MAYWRIPFKSFLGKNLEVLISGATKDTYLTGASAPFETQETTSENVFTPVRKQTGYVRFIDTTGTTWKDILPTGASDRPVTLMDNDSHSVLWKGYIKPETFSITMKEKPVEISLPVMCQMSILDYHDVETISSPKATVLYTLMTMLNTADNEWEDLYISNNRRADYAGTDGWLQRDLPALLIWRNFFEIKEGNISPRMTKLKVIEELCKLFGWTCRTDGKRVYFISIDGKQGARDFLWHADLRGVDLSALTPLSNSWITWANESTSHDIYPFGEYAPVDPQFASTQNTIKIIQGYREVTVTGDANKNEPELTAHEGEMQERLYGNMRQNTKYQTSVTQTNIPVATGVPSNYFVWECKNEAITSPQRFNDGTILTFPSMSDIGLFRIAKSGEVKNNFEFEFGFSTEFGQTITLENPYFYLNDNAVDVVIKADWRRAFVIPADDAPNDRSKDELIDDTYSRIDFNLRIGDKWLQQDGTWGETKPTTFITAVGNNRDLYSETEEYEGYGFHITDAIRHKQGILLEFRASKEWTQSSWIVKLSSVEVSVANMREDITQDVYEEKLQNSKTFRETLSINTIFTPAREQVNGLGCVTCRQDVHAVLAQRAAEFYNKMRKIIKIETRPTNNSNTPTPLTTAYSSDFQAYPISISRKWHDDIYKTIYIETT